MHNPSVTLLGPAMPLVNSVRSSGGRHFLAYLVKQPRADCACLQEK